MMIVCFKCSPEEHAHCAGVWIFIADDLLRMDLQIPGKFVACLKNESPLPPCLTSHIGNFAHNFSYRRVDLNWSHRRSITLLLQPPCPNPKTFQALSDRRLCVVFFGDAGTALVNTKLKSVRVPRYLGTCQEPWWAFIAKIALIDPPFTPPTTDRSRLPTNTIFLFEIRSCICANLLFNKCDSPSLIGLLWTQQ